MRAYQYEVTEQSPEVFKTTYGLGTKWNAENATTLAEAVEAKFFPDEAAVVAKAEAQRNISAVHAAKAWVLAELKAGRTPTSADVEARIRGFRYEKVTVRDPNAPKAERSAGSGEIKAAKAAKEEFDSGRAKLYGEILAGKFGATALDSLVNAGMVKVEELRAHHASVGGELPPAVRKLLGA